MNRSPKRMLRAVLGAERSLRLKQLAKRSYVRGLDLLDTVRTPREQPRSSDIVWLDLGDFGDLLFPLGTQEKWQDHGLGLLRTILHREGVLTDVRSTRNMRSVEQLARELRGYRTLLMNVRSYTFPMARKAAEVFKRVNPQGVVLTGGMHASVAPDEMRDVPQFDRICAGGGESVIVPLVKDPSAYPRFFRAEGTSSMAEWPEIDRDLWPQPEGLLLRRRYHWPLEPDCGWGPSPVASVLTSRVCPWQCSFCNESSYIPAMSRRPVAAMIEELNRLDERHGVGSVVIHDSMFFQDPSWLRQLVDEYPRKARKLWPYWAAGRADTVRQWPELFEALVRETNWNTISIGFESGSDRVLKILNKECTEEDNEFTIDLVNRLGDELERQGRKPPVFWCNIILGVPGETREDAFKTMRMVKRMKRVMPSVALYAPYPGSALGHQLIAEGKSLMSKDNYHRFPSDEKVKGIDYGFYRDLLAGKYAAEVNRGLDRASRAREMATPDALGKA